MSVAIEDQLRFELEQAKESLRNNEQFIADQEFYERLVQEPDWKRAKEDLQKEIGVIRGKIDDALTLLVEARGSQKIDIQDMIVELSVRLDQGKAFLDWFDTKVKLLKLAKENIVSAKEVILKLQEDLKNG